MSTSPDVLTLLFLHPMGVPTYSARGLTQVLEPIQQINQGTGTATLRRAVSGKLLNLSPPQFQLYSTTITGSDVDPPAFDGTWPGTIIDVDCISELAFSLTSGGQQRQSADSGSYREDGEFGYYRPRLRMMVTSMTTSKDEWGAITGWTLSAEELGGD